MLEDRLTAQSNIPKAGKKGLWIVGDKMTIADVACFSWVNWTEWAGVDVNGFKKLEEVRSHIDSRPAVQKGLDVPEPFEVKKKMQTKVRTHVSLPQVMSWLTIYLRRAKKSIRRCTANG